MHVFNPDDFTVRINVRLMQEGRAFDLVDVSELSDDAVPALLENLPAMNYDQQYTIKDTFSYRFNQAQGKMIFAPETRTRSIARKGLEQHSESFDTSLCPAHTKRNNRF